MAERWSLRSDPRNHLRAVEFDFLILLSGFFLLVCAAFAVGALQGKCMATGALVLGLFIIVSQLVRNYGVISIQSIFFLISFIYISAAIVDYSVFDNVNGYDVNYVVWVTLVGLAALFSFTLGVLFRGSSEVANQQASRAYLSDRVLLSSVLLLPFVFGGYLSFSLSYLGTFGVITRAELYRSVPLAFELIKLSLPVVIIIASVAMALREKKTSLAVKLFVGLAAITYVSVEMVLYGDRRISLSMILCLVILRNSIKRISGLWVMAAPFAAVALVLLGYFRNQAADKFAIIAEDLSAWRILNPANTEFGAFHVVGSTLFQQPFLQVASFSVFEVPFALVPRVLLPDRPTAPSVEFLQSYFPDIYAVGGGLAYNLVFEFYQNFWYLGPFVLGLLLARIVVYLSLHPKSYVAYIVVWNLFFAMRMDLVSLCRGVLFSVAVYGFVRLIGVVLFRVRR